MLITEFVKCNIDIVQVCFTISHIFYPQTIRNNSQKLGAL